MGYSQDADVINKMWLGKATLEDYRLKVLKVNVERVISLDVNQVDKIKKLYRNMHSAIDVRLDLERVLNYYFVEEMPKDILYEIIYDFEKFYIDRNSKSYIPDRFNNLTEFDIDEEVLEMEEGLDELAQRSVYARRPIGSKQPDNRSEFQRDRDRIIHAKAFRRLVDKAQVYTTIKGDHYRTRMTHTLEVSQIARSISRILKLNEDLTEAIALGHDLGHTPFGHQGERELDDVMSGKIKLSDTHKPENYGGFKHNFQGVRIANYLEEKYPNYEGLDLTYQTLDGILKHTKIKKCKNDCPKCVSRCYEIEQFLEIGNKEELNFDYVAPVTLEGQVVSWADEIAQIEHDLDDGISSGVFSIEQLVNELEEMGGMDEIIGKIVQAVDNVDQRVSQGRTSIDINDLYRAEIVSRVLGFFKRKLIEQSKRNIEEYKADHLEDFEQSHIIREKVIDYAVGEFEMLKNMGKMINNKIINSQEVNCFDGKSKYVVRKLFKAYYSNPKQLPDNIIARIEREMNNFKLSSVNIRRGDRDEVNEQIEIYKGQKATGNDAEDFLKQKIFMRCIADYIAGMTDNYALNQYKRLYAII